MTHVPSPHVRRVLIIEDEFLIALDLEATMFKLGFDVCALAPSAGKARALAMSDQPDVALVDIGLPVMDGYGLATRVREKLGPDRVRLIAMTGFGQPSDRQRSREAGYDDHVVKPPAVETLRKILSFEEH